MEKETYKAGDIGKPINRIALYMAMELAHIDITYYPEKLSDTAPIFSFMGSGASDILTLGELKDFCKAVQELNRAVTIPKTLMDALKRWRKSDDDCDEAELIYEVDFYLKGLEGK